MKVNPKTENGCWVDSSRGIYQGCVVQTIAMDYEWSGKCCLDVESDEYSDAIREAEDFMNESVAPEGWYFGSNENGDWGLWSLPCTTCQDHAVDDCSECRGESARNFCWRAYV